VNAFPLRTASISVGWRITSSASWRTRSNEWNIKDDDSYFKELDKRYHAGFFNTDLFGYNPEWDNGDDSWSTRAIALKIAKDLFKRGKGLEWE
jgi:hypothetical protein